LGLFAEGGDVKWKNDSFQRECVSLL